MTKEYKSTLNLPQTAFPIKANLSGVEEEVLSFWETEKLYPKLLKKNHGKPKFILHDGPPYPNGDIHLGHALNKILKDIIVKSKMMQGFDSPYIPGWDCHGLPIETQLLKESGKQSVADDEKTDFRAKCRDYALKYVDVQRREFRRLGILGQWDEPYLTLDFSYESRIAEVFGKLAEKGYVYRGLKPIHWCPSCETALAEAELEYEDDRSPSIYVKFKLLSKLPDQIKFQIDPNRVFFVIWTTTPWTLPANVAIALNPDLEYVFLDTGDDIYVVAEGLSENFKQKLNLLDAKVIGKAPGSMLEGQRFQHPFLPRQVVSVLDRYVSLEQGTGLVHIAPGHGVEDFMVGQRYKLPVIMPVDEKGVLTKEAGPFAGMDYQTANKAIGQQMQADGSLLLLEFIKHPYPHCWRCKKPVIFRATEQWFVSVDHNDLRGQALAEIKKTKWIPDWGQNRIEGMVKVRPDWCISRQRSWGVPIPAFYCVACKKVHMTGRFNEAVKNLFAKEGTAAWFTKSSEDILPADLKCECGSSQFAKETDILDVWFESGVSHAAVLKDKPDLAWPADLYLEGSDQHRGWFQSSLLVSTGAYGQAPFKQVLTHGFTIDDKGKKMSKSLGNVVDPNAVTKEYGADVLRLWVASADFRNDLAASPKILKQVQEAYTKIRNTCRFMISNLGEFSEKDRVPYNQMLEVDQYALLVLHRLIEKFAKAYNDYDFHVVYHGLYNYCVNDLSAFYLDLSKDRLYCSAKNSIERRSALTAMEEILNAMVLIFAPILSFTAEDINRYLATKGKESAPMKDSVLLKSFPVVNKEYLNEKLAAKWDAIMQIRQSVNKVLEILRAEKEIGAPLEAQVKIYASNSMKAQLNELKPQLAMIFICSKVEIADIGDVESQSAVEVDGLKDVKIAAKKASGDKCQRCWIYSDFVGKDSEHPTLCDRCAKVVKAG
jgi:isoleucyl-tRNA synthetase